MGRESLTCRISACLFNQSYMGKLFLTGPEATAATRHLFSRDVTGKARKNPCTYTLMLNKKGGIEADLIVTKLQSKKEGKFPTFITFCLICTH